MSRDTVDVGAEIAELRELLDPLVWLDSSTVNVAGTGVFSMALPPYAFAGVVKADGITADDPAEARRALLARAEGILVALADAGWQLTEYPRMEFTGKIVRPFVRTLDGDLAAPAEQGAIELKIELGVDRPRRG